ncbi:hypothetical protein [Roseivirga sp.]|uniref:hypothetical protein n=1 Tax=Roseivirga sp. TaxID=1964215 RepID=UPI002B275752|nr:hypothetical protein [Roseivirga sp.]
MKPTVILKFSADDNRAKMEAPKFRRSFSVTQITKTNRHSDDEVRGRKNLSVQGLGCQELTLRSFGAFFTLRYASGSLE